MIEFSEFPRLNCLASVLESLAESATMEWPDNWIPSSL